MAHAKTNTTLGAVCLAADLASTARIRFLLWPGACQGSGKYSAGATFTATGSVVPIGLANASATATPTSLQTLWATNQFTAPVTAGRNVSFGMISQGKPQKGKVPFPKEMKVDFSARDGFATVVVAFQAMAPLKDLVQLQIHDVDNHHITQGDPIKITLRTGETQERSWSFPLTIHPGIYRADVLVGQEVGWREYFQISA